MLQLDLQQQPLPLVSSISGGLTPSSIGGALERTISQILHADGAGPTSRLVILGKEQEPSSPQSITLTNTAKGQQNSISTPQTEPTLDDSDMLSAGIIDQLKARGIDFGQLRSNGQAALVQLGWLLRLSKADVPIGAAEAVTIYIQYFIDSFKSPTSFPSAQQIFAGFTNKYDPGAIVWSGDVENVWGYPHFYLPDYGQPNLAIHNQVDNSSRRLHFKFSVVNETAITPTGPSLVQMAKRPVYVVNISKDFLHEIMNIRTFFGDRQVK